MRAELSRIVQDFAGTILNPYDPQDMLHRLTDQSMVLLAAAGSGIMLQDEQANLRFAAASEDRIMDIELHQERASEGACFEAFTANELVIVTDVAAELERWPRYAERVLANGMGSVIGVPMNAFGRTIGVINIYRDAPTVWTDEDVTAAQIMAAMGAGYVVHANELRAHLDLTEQLQTAIDSRDVIGQAKGIIMARLAVDADDAFELLRNGSQTLNTKLRDVAATIVDGSFDLDVLNRSRHQSSCRP